MQSKGVVIGIPAFDSKQVDRVCEACQLEKQHRHPFPKERNVSKGLLDVVVKIQSLGTDREVEPPEF